MTREEQIVEYLKDRNIPINSLEANSIMEGIEWVDKHPNPDMVNKQEFIEKAISYFTPILKTYCSEECVKELIDGFIYSMGDRLN